MMSYVPTTYIPRWNRAYWAPSQLSAPSLSAVWGACFFHVDLWWFVSRRADAKGPVPIGWWWQWKRFGIWLREADLWEANWIGRWKTLVVFCCFVMCYVPFWVEPHGEVVEHSHWRWSSSKLAWPSCPKRRCYSHCIAYDCNGHTDADHTLKRMLLWYS